MTPATTFAGQSVALFGLGGSGLATALALQAGGASVIACDDNPDSMARAQAQGIGTGDLRETDWSRFSAFVLSPGVPLTHPEPHWTVPLAKAAGVAIIGDIEIFGRERAKIAPDAPFVAITGTNGKSTTTALIAHLLRHAGRDVQMGGNIGTAILSLEPPSKERVHVIEMSTFQIDLTPSLNPSVGVLLNVTPDHLDRHGTMENYAAIKARLVEGASAAVVGTDDPFCEDLFHSIDSTRGGVLGISGRRSSFTSRLFYDAGLLQRAWSLGANSCMIEVLTSLDGIPTLRGAHNGQNAAAAFATCEWLGVAHDAIAAGLRTFPGLPHRMEPLGRRGRVLFVNDSKATNADSAEKALTAFHDVHWIVGGKAKEGGIAALEPLFGRVAHAYLIGASSDDFAKQLDGRIPFTRCGTLDVATAKAAEAAMASDAPEPVVLLSPACASYDQFKNFEERGNRFQELVKPLL